MAKIAPCQGFQQGFRMDYPVSGGLVSWAATKDIHDIQVRYSTDSNPTSQDQFQNALTNITGGWVGHQCIDGPNFAALGLKAGDEVTMQFTYKTGPGKWDMYEVSLTRLTPTGSAY